MTPDALNQCVHALPPPGAMPGAPPAAQPTSTKVSEGLSQSTPCEPRGPDACTKGTEPYRPIGWSRRYSNTSRFMRR